MTFVSVAWVQVLFGCYTLYGMVEYDDLAKFYFERRTDISRFDYNRDIEVPGMLAAVGDVEGLRVLDEGCGFGDHLLRLAAQRPAELAGLDVSKELISFAAQQNVPNSHFATHDLNTPLPFDDEYFDKIFASLTTFYVKNLRQLFAENYRTLKPGGQFIFSIFHPVLMLMNTSGRGIVGTRRDSQGRLQVYGDYFNESLQEASMGGLGRVKVYPYTLQTYFDTLAKVGFRVKGYRDLLPVSESKKYPEKYKLTTTLPTFIVITATRPDELS